MVPGAVQIRNVLLRHIKRQLNLIVFWTLTALLGCDDGAQHGQFVVNGSSSRAVAGMAGKLTVVRGDTTPLTSRSTGQKPLMYILAVAPGVKAFGSGTSACHGNYVSSWRWTWQTSTGTVSIEFCCDRRTAIVTAGGTTFDWKRGSAFVLVRDMSGNVSATQVGTIDAGLDEFVALQQIQAKLPQSSPAKTVTLMR